MLVKYSTLCYRVVCRETELLGRLKTNTAVLEVHDLKTFAETLVQMLEDVGVRYIFGIPSGTWIPFMEAIRRSDMEFVLVATKHRRGLWQTFVDG